MGMITWMLKKQTTIALLTMEAEYVPTPGNPVPMDVDAT
jgi:hypothetical protein